MLSPGNPYVLPSTLVAAAAYLAATFLTDASVLVRIGVLVLLARVVPVVLNRLLGGSTEAATEDAATEEGVEEPPEA
ncbi:hypothetical protein [Halorubrum sp. SD626R]|uniref:hypothetical protein n=1 Tax=Halorubrum sp. SD626R TaxID=1419722 RepID=UPI000B80FD9F|nr:hypothetical protein [Halorubrum sp. SD626R]